MVHRIPAFASPVILASLLFAGCEQGLRNMYNQPKHPPYAESRFFPHGQSVRPVVPDTVARAAGPLAGTSSGRLGPLELYPQPGPVLPLGPAGEPMDERAGKQTQGDLPDTNPLPMTLPILAKGQERYNIYCVPCHGLLGDGDGIVPRRGFPQPPSYHSKRLRKAPDWYFYAVISHGFGVMYPYADRIGPTDRWAVVAYIRALQLSQHAPLDALPPPERLRLEETRG